ncbi:MAG TPA: DUF2111 domain-containing protein [Methanocella sp.]|uniref:DUF2111 domain-containing protein n=1 Tax=Methanocella sp. TaxID=2052833 RepID=UPI002D02CED3|nr:DUF2111 domain-containing protein [Methanocella sp.]HTY92083.1 DUF2111 domain-containing protein [Methanocella sp.]
MPSKERPIIIDVAKSRKPVNIQEWRSGDFKTLIYRNADAIVVLNSDGYILYTNPAAESLFDLSLAELVGAHFGFPIILDEPVELQIVNKSKELITAEMRMVEVAWAGQRCYLLSFRDLTDRTLAWQAISQSWDRLEEMVEERTRELLDANLRLEREVEAMKFRAMSDSSLEEITAFALAVHNTVCSMPVAIKTRNCPGVLIEEGDFAISARECQHLDCVFTGGHARRIYIDQGKYVGTNMFASPIVNHQGEHIAAIGIIDILGILSLEMFVADQESIHRQLGNRNRGDKHLIRSRR